MTTISKGIEKGTILRCTWGEGQQNVDFYQVVNRSPKMVVIRQIRNKVAEENESYTGKVIPMPGHFIGMPVRKKVISRIDRDEFVIIEKSANAYIWNGNPVRFSTYN